VLFVNGIPVAIFEFKSAIREDTTIYDAWKQITNRYNRDIPKLMKYCFLSVISDAANNRLGSIFTPYEYYYAWSKINENEKISNGIASLLTMLKGAFAKDRLVAILQDFIYYPDNSTENETIVTRYPQFFAAQKMFDNVKAHLKPNGDGKGGTYFGATGCGKTYTMLFLARLLNQRDRDILKNPTIIIITDRDDLDRQAAELFVESKRYLRDKDVRRVKDRKELGEILDEKETGAAS
jgi:type I restriction enzyme R subunit